MSDLRRLPARDEEPTLGVLLHDYARTRGRTAFAVQLVDGAVMTSLAMFSHSKPWIAVALVGVGMSSHALWSVADLRLAESDTSASWHWRALRIAAGLGGTAAVFALLLTIFGPALGTWIS